jgi:hypothetical protein
MGWASGSQLFSNLIATMRKHVKDKSKRKAIYKEMIISFEDEDWDTQDECEGEDSAFDEALDELAEKGA